MSYQQVQQNKAEDLSKMKCWIMAIRPKTLAMSVVPVLVGTVVASDHAALDWMLTIIMLVTALLVQIGINVVNDALDFKKGADTKERIGFQRVTQSGLLSYKEVLMGGLLCFAAALLVGTPLILAGGWPLLIALVLSVIFGYLYTGGPFPIAYNALGEVFVLIFFGYVIVGSAYYLQTGTIGTDALLAATQIGLLAIVPIVINNTRDIQTDAKAGKTTLSNLFGLTFSRWLIAACSLIPFILGIAWIGFGHLYMALLPFIALPLVIKNLKSLWTTEPSREWNRYFAKAPLCLFIFGFFLIVGRFI